MMVLRGHRADQAKWGPGWTWEDVEPAYIKSESAFPRADLRDRHELTLAFVNAAVAAGLERRDLNGPDTEGVGFVPVSQRRGRRYSVADGYLRPARRRRNLEVVTGAEAQRVLIERGRAYGVAFQRAETVHAAHVRREVILCAGAIGSPHLLLLSSSFTSSRTLAETCKTIWRPAFSSRPSGWKRSTAPSRSAISPAGSSAAVAR